MRIVSVLAAAVLAGGLTLGAAAKLEGEPAPQPLVTTAWLALHLHDPNLVLLQVGEEGEYRTAHLPGARFVKQSDVAVSANGRTLELPGADDLRRRLQALGISDQSRVVVYFGSDWVSPSTRILFTLQAAGLGARASLLDGGMPKWRREGRAVTDQPPGAPRATTLAPLRFHPEVVDADFVRAHAGRPGYALIDARAPVFYTGVEQGGPHSHMKRGHIPGAINLPFTSVTHDDGTFLKPAELLALFRKAGVRPGDKAIVYCHVGQQGSAIVFAARAAGIQAFLYDGSFEDWALRDLPVEA